MGRLFIPLEPQMLIGLIGLAVAAIKPSARAYGIPAAMAARTTPSFGKVIDQADIAHPLAVEPHIISAFPIWQALHGSVLDAIGVVFEVHHDAFGDDHRAHKLSREGVTKITRLLQISGFAVEEELQGFLLPRQRVDPQEGLLAHGGVALVVYRHLGHMVLYPLVSRIHEIESFDMI